MTPLDPSLLPRGVRTQIVHDVNGLDMHVLEAGFEPAGRPCVLLLHGFPELAFSWRKVIPALADAGFHVVAPDQRGYGRTTGWDGTYDGDVASFRMLNLVQDALALVFALGHAEVAGVIGHDFGSPVAALCALIRPDVFRRVALLSAPFAGPPALPFATRSSAPSAPLPDIHAALAALDPPRKHYQWYYSTRQADADMRYAPQGLQAFLRAYFHYKSADWSGNRPHRLDGWTAEALAVMPTYYIMHRDQTMAETVAAFMPTAEQIAACQWLTEGELGVYCAEFERTGFQGGLNWYRCMTDPHHAKELRLFSGRSIDVPSIFIAGASDWGVYQFPGAVDRMQQSACSRMGGVHLIEGAGHWVQQEQPQAVIRLLLTFLDI